MSDNKYVDGMDDESQCENDKKVVEEAKMTSMNAFRYREMVDLYHRYFNEEENDESSNI